jgi:hypothetical protein
MNPVPVNVRNGNAKCPDRILVEVDWTENFVEAGHRFTFRQVVRNEGLRLRCGASRKTNRRDPAKSQ